MRRMFGCLFLVIVTFLCSPIRAQETDENLKMMRRIYSKLTQMFTLGSQSSSSLDGFAPGQAVLILLNPGIYIDPDIDPSKPEGRLALALILNRLPKVSWIYEDAGSNISDVYERVMDDSEAVYRQPTEAQKKRLAEVEKQLFNQAGDPSGAYQKYLDKRDAFDSAFAACEEDRGDKPDCKAQLKNKKTAARNDWETSGKKNQIEGALQEFHQLTQTAAAWFGQLRSRFQASQETADGIPFHRVLAFPAYKAWNDSKGWGNYTLTDTKLEVQTESNRVSHGGGGGVNFGLFSIGGSSFTNTNKTYARSKTDGINIEVEIKRVTLFRPWMNRVVFESDRWRFGPATASAALKISDGKGNQTTAPTGLMPLLPTGVLLARKVKISGLDQTDITTHFDQQTSSGGSIGWGPFRLGGNYNESTTRDYKFAKKVGNALESSDPQIIGFYCEVLKETPKPTTDPTVQWLSDPPSPPTPQP